MLSAKQRRWYEAVLDWGLKPGPPALEASTIPLGYRGGGIQYEDMACITLIYVKPCVKCYVEFVCKHA